MKKIIRWTSFVLLCLTLSNCLPVIYAGPGLRTIPINYYNPTTQTTTPFFAYGWASAHGTWLNDTYLSECGGNTVIANCSAGDDPNSLILLLNRAATHDKKVIVDLGADFMYGANSTANITEMVNALKNHPALLCWLLGDENEWHPSPTAAEVVTSAALVHTLDTHRQIIQVFSGFGYFDRNKNYNTDGVDPFSDCLQYDYLPNTDV